MLSCNYFRIRRLADSEMVQQTYHPEHYGATSLEQYTLRFEIMNQDNIIGSMSLIKQHHISFNNAFKGIIWAFTTQPNFRIHLLLSIFSMLLGILLQISYLEMVLIVLTIVFGLGIEMVNTSIEAMTDLITIEWKQQAKIAKDVAAGMMLLTAIGATLIAGLIFLPKLINIFFL